MTEDLKLKKLCARWVLHLLGPEEKPQRISKVRDLLQLFDCRCRDSWVTGDKSWFMCHQMESKQQNMVWFNEDDERSQVKEMDVHNLH